MLLHQPPTVRQSEIREDLLHISWKMFITNSITLWRSKNCKVKYTLETGQAVLSLSAMSLWIVDKVILNETMSRSDPDDQPGLSGMISMVYM